MYKYMIKPNIEEIANNNAKPLKNFFFIKPTPQKNYPIRIHINKTLTYIIVALFYRMSRKK